MAVPGFGDILRLHLKLWLSDIGTWERLEKSWPNLFEEVRTQKENSTKSFITHRLTIQPVHNVSVVDVAAAIDVVVEATVLDEDDHQRSDENGHQDLADSPKRWKLLKTYFMEMSVVSESSQ